MSTSKLSPTAIRILKDVCQIPDDGMLEIRKLHYEDISLEDFYNAVIELDITGMVTFMRRPTIYKPPINQEDANRKSKFPFFIKLKGDYKEICKVLIS